MAKSWPGVMNLSGLLLLGVKQASLIVRCSISAAEKSQTRISKLLLCSVQGRKSAAKFSTGGMVAGMAPLATISLWRVLLCVFWKGYRWGSWPYLGKSSGEYTALCALFGFFDVWEACAGDQSMALYNFRLDLEQQMCCKSVTCLPRYGLYSSCEAVSKEICKEINLIAIIPISLMQTSSWTFLFWYKQFNCYNSVAVQFKLN